MTGKYKNIPPAEPVCCPRCGEQKGFMFTTNMRITISARYYGKVVASDLKNVGNGLYINSVDYLHPRFRCKKCLWQGGLEDYAELWTERTQGKGNGR